VHFDIICPQHDPTKGVCKPNASQETIEVNEFVMVLRLPPSCFTYAMIQALSPYFASTSLTCKTMAFLEVFIVSKKPISLPFVIQKTARSSQRYPFQFLTSKDQIDNINLSLVYFATLGNISFTKVHLDEKTTQEFCLITSFLKDKGHQFLGYEQGQVFFKLFLFRVVLAIRSSTIKKV
jgi:hypothetical protein